MVSLPAEPRGKPKNTGVGSLSLLQQIFLIQESNQGLLHCRQILYQLSYEGSIYVSISYMYTYISSLLDLPPRPPCCSPISAICAIIAPSELPVLGSRFPLVVCFTHARVYMSIPNLPIHPLLSPPHVHAYILYLCISIPALEIGSSIPFF